jgi:hypothetical protein
VTNAISTFSLYPSSMLQLSSNRDFDLNTSLNVDDDLLDDLGRSIKTALKISTCPKSLETPPPTYSIKRLWILISKVSQVLDPSPQGVFRVVTLRVLVGRRTGPLTRRSLPLARSMSSWQTFSRDWTLREVKVMRILWVFCRKTNVRISLWGRRRWDVRGRRRTLFLAFGRT